MSSSFATNDCLKPCACANAMNPLPVSFSRPPSVLKYLRHSDSSLPSLSMFLRCALIAAMSSTLPSIFTSSAPYELTCAPLRQHLARRWPTFGKCRFPSLTHTLTRHCLRQKERRFRALHCHPGRSAGIGGRAGVSRAPDPGSPPSAASGMTTDARRVQTGGDKASQRRDIARAKAMARGLGRSE
jgi:hypothetical protein